MKTFYFFVLLFISVKTILAQNLVLNPSFEEIDEAFGNSNNFKGVNNWETHDNSQTYYLNELFCLEHPESCYGFRKAKTGKTCAVALHYSISPYSYLQGVLSQPLQKGAIYQVELYYMLADSSDISLHEISISLTPNIIENYSPKSSKPWPWVITGPLKNTKNWQYFSFSYIAKGGERIISIGFLGKYFNSNEVKYDLIDKDFWQKRNITSQHLIQRYPLKAIYFLDDVSVYEEKLINDLGRLSSIYFENNSFKLPISSLEKLDKLLRLKAVNLANYNLVIRGYTDQNGEEVDNDTLSQKRAKSVADYLIQKGMPTNRIEIQAFGESMANDINNTNDRRVDILLKSKE